MGRSTLANSTNSVNTFPLTTYILFSSSQLFFHTMILLSDTILLRFYLINLIFFLFDKCQLLSVYLGYFSVYPFNLVLGFLVLLSDLISDSLLNALLGFNLILDFPNSTL